MCPWQGEQIVGADPEQLLRRVSSENGIENNLQFNSKYMLSSPNDGLLELVGHDELEGSLHPHLGVGQLQIHGWQPGLSPSLLPGGLQLLGQGIRIRYKVVSEIQI